MSTRPIAMHVVASSHHVLDFLFQRLFHNQTGRQLHQLAAIGVRPASIK